MFTLTRSGKRNILFNARLHNPAQLTFCPAQFASKKRTIFIFPRTLSEGLNFLSSMGSPHFSTYHPFELLENSFRKINAAFFHDKIVILVCHHV